MKMYKIKRQFIRLILRPLKVLRLSLVYFYGRFALALAIRGIKLPGLNAIKKRMPTTALGAFERQVLIYEIKSERYFFRIGPLWIRKIIDQISFLFAKNKFWFLIVVKATSAIVIIAIPILFFILIRGILPVPERVPYKNINNKLTSNSNIKVDWLYTEKIPSNQENLLYANKKYNFINPNDSRGVSISPVLENNVPNGLLHFGIGYYPIKFNLVRGFLVSENSSIEINKIKNVPIEVEDGNKLRIQYYLFPTKDRNIHQCKIELFDENGNILTNLIEHTPQKIPARSATSLKTAWNERFIPNSSANFGNLGEFIINLKIPPKKIIAKVTEVDINKEAGKNIFLNANDKDYSEIFKQTFPNSKGTDITDENCIFALGDFSFERRVVNPPKRRGIIFIVIDTLKAETAYDEDLMPNLNFFAKETAVKFLEHRAQSNMTVPSIVSLMTSNYPREVGTVAFAYAADYKSKKNFYHREIPTIATTMQNLGYRVGGIGWLSLFTEALEGGLDLGFHNAIITENPEYEARIITEQMGNWLENYGEAPFFLYLHYNTSHGPYKPPVDKIDLTKFFSKPFGLNQKRQLYNGVARYWDSELPNILQKLKDLGIYENVDIVITADHGAQLNVLPWYYFLGVPQNIDGGYADKGNSLFDEELRVPLIIKIAEEKQHFGRTISIPTTHVDLFPTISNIAGDKIISHNWKGIDFSNALKNDSQYTFSDLLKNRNHIYFDAHKYAGMLYWDDIFAKKPVKYIRQLTPDSVKLYLTHNPWSEKISWYQPEMFSSVNFNDHSEKIVPNVSYLELKKLRQEYFKISPSDKMLRLTSKYNGILKFDLEIDNLDFNHPPQVSLLPEKIKFESIRKNSDYIFTFNGKIAPEEEIWINLGKSNLVNLDFKSENKLVVCSNGNLVDKKFVTKVINDNICSFYSPPNGLMDLNYKNTDNVIVIKKTLANEQVQQIEGAGAGAALQNALRDWGYAK
ncbi:sulfatase [Pigmentibacter sp. JX0631]|uniref:sulfatase n=1 Tax=Pigmentibacter sp. JX0631 TaxID=2976982 RepID=UPI002469B500|nr:sulfatase [Pigmentibacter sp. JX0631]WGL58556.1 sulfatase [Pigmentibacter sp. JX0631]